MMTDAIAPLADRPVCQDDVDDQFDDRGGGEELATAVAFGDGEVAEEVLVDLSEGVACLFY